MVRPGPGNMKYAPILAPRTLFERFSSKHTHTHFTPKVSVFGDLRSNFRKITLNLEHLKPICDFSLIFK